MYARRIKILVALIALLVIICLLRLAQMQLLSGSFYYDEVDKLRTGPSRQLKTVRGRILDRNGKVLAADEPRFQLCINYRLTCLLDERVKQTDTGGRLQDRLEDLDQVIQKCARFKGTEPAQIKEEMQRINDFVWSRRTFQAWRTNFPNTEILKDYDDIRSIPLSAATADFETKEPDPAKRLDLVNKADIAEMKQSWPVVDLQTDDDLFTAQLEFLDVGDVDILPKAQRTYPYGAVAAQTIGWVGLPQKHDSELFAGDRLSTYLEDEVCGREDGVEYVCETVLRGRRGESVYDIDRKLVSHTPTQFGKDVATTLDIDLQQRIETYITDCNLNTNCKAPTAVVVIDVLTGDILALVSTPIYDLNRVRYDYAALEKDPNEPLRNRAINKHYPPGSSIKPLILIAGLESGRITPDEVISCPAQDSPKGWPNCWIFNRYRTGHTEWLNKARNAIKGSCNVYFSRLADRIDPQVLQQWLLKFGYGREVPFAPPSAADARHSRNLRQVPGIISTRTPSNNEAFSPEKFPIESRERRFFGIGQGNLRVTPLQVANAMAVIARKGIYKFPRLFIEDPNDSEAPPLAGQVQNDIALGISPKTLDTICDGMSAVVNESGGTAAKEFAHSGLTEQGVKVYGKTGSTEKPDHAWFAGFAADGKGRSISIAVLVEGGQHGSSDAAPLARDIIHFCIEAGYVGQAPN
ncbi:MAG TPA: penicillin-binding transpeptidase domain-containing protein [Sedimentisphaerales bacterium]|nr:penicillin-binding transpeptidase domain-containing protein [Sedimentisphaerales bacterium]